MRILIFNWGAYTYLDIKDSFDYMGIENDTVNYRFSDKNNDEYFVSRFSQVLKSKKYDAVFSVNFFPLVAKCCNDSGIIYISWSYDNPLNVVDIEKSLGYKTNFVFLFDKAQVQKYVDKGFTNVFHSPLAANTRRLDSVVSDFQDKQKYSADVSFVGRLYSSGLGLYMSAMDDFEKGYIDSIIGIQKQLYGTFLLNDLITDEFVKMVNNTYAKRFGDDDSILSKEALVFAIAAQVTREERITLLALLASKFKVNLYSSEQNEFLKNVNLKGSCKYLNEMPKVFKLSKINLNITLKSIESGIPLRALDIMGSGGFLLSNYQSELAEYFVDGKDIALYESVEDAFEKASFYLSHEAERKRIAENAYEKVKNEFSYEHQLNIILKKTGIL